MAEIHGVPGEWARVKGTVIGFWPMLLGAFACGFAVALAIFYSRLIGSCLFVIAMVGMGWSVVRGFRRVESYFKGAKGEERVAGILKNLPPTYHVFNDFVAGNAHVDHVVVGPAGVFAVETKFWRGKVTIDDGHVLVDGRLPSRPPLAQVRREADLVRAELTRMGWRGSVTPVLAFASDTFTQHVAELNGAVVMNSCELMSSFGTKSVVIAQDELVRLVTLMENRQQ